MTEYFIKQYAMLHHQYLEIINNEALKAKSSILFNLTFMSTI